MQNQWKKITLPAATNCWMLAPLNVVRAETNDEEKLDTAIELMRKALEEADKRNYILGPPWKVCLANRMQIGWT